MSDPDGDTRPRMSRAELRRLREALQHDGALHPSPSLAPARQGGSILTVCTGNICRSPMAEMLLQAALRDVHAQVHSAGTHALVDHEMTSQAQQLAVANGADPASAAAHRARTLTSQILQESDLILTMAREHRSFTVQLLPAVLHRVFTVREFARLAASLSDAEVRNGVATAGSDAAGRVRALARLIAAQRGVVPPAPDDDDVIDPYRRSDETYAKSARQLVPAAAESARVIRAALA